ncbi:hypothetical protein P279_29880, partial [Rhodobacteraceae bacterium PD-2]
MSGERQRSGRCGIMISRSAGPADFSVSIRKRSGANARLTILKIRKEMKAVAAKRRGFGYRRIGVMLER